MSIAKITWQNEWNTGIHQVDVEHQKLLSIINRLGDIAPTVSIVGSEELSEIMSELSYYISKHFYHEEHILRSAEYPDLTDHMIQHAHFKRAIAEFTIQIMNPKNELAAYRLFSFLRDWLIDHILQEDMKYVPFIGSDVFPKEVQPC